MVILHVANITNNKFNGVCVVVPRHVQAQAQYAKVALLNLNAERIEGVDEQFAAGEDFSLENLPKPFSLPDIVIFHECYRAPYLKISKQLKKKKIPYVIIPHGELTNEAQRKKWLKKKVANFLLFNRFIKGAVAIQCLSERECDNVRFGKRKFVGTNGIVLPSIKKSWGDSESIRIVYVGRLEVNIKGLDIMINAIAKIKDQLSNKNVEFYIYGPDLNGRFESVKSLIEENGVQDIVTLNREVSGKEKEDILLNSDVFMQTSRSEGMPLGILEALSYGVPVLITKGTTLGEIVEKYDAGWVSETDSKSLAQKIIKVLEQKTKFSEKGANAMRLVSENFLWDKISKDAVEKYKQLI
ncbi:MAG: glycosyltransferase family 4 protein [Clostridia bacterium]|nr:glycosyltransferase family 4 protein [Clostridia bacterium]